MVSREPLERLTIRAALFLGFGLTLGIWLFAGYHFTRRMADVQERSAAVNARYTRAQELLSTVRAKILLGSVYVRDALLDPDPTTVAAYRRQLEKTYQAVDSGLNQYVPVLDSSAERAQIATLRREINAFHATMVAVLESDNSRWPTDARTLLRTQIVPRRELVIRVSEQLQTLNRNSYVQQQSAVAAIYARAQRRVWISLGMTLAANFAIAVLATLYAGRLERRIRGQRANEAQYATDLERLSSKLITAQEEERRTIARELHDEVGQVLMTIKVELAIAQRAVEAGGGRAEILENARTITNGALQTVRDLSHLLHPSLLDDLGLADAVQWYLRGYDTRHGIRTELLHDRMDERLTPEIEASVYRIIQEALTNVAKHAQASTCRVYLQRLTHTLLVTIEDDGIGFDPSTQQRPDARRSGLGLIGIRERAAQLRGTVRLETAAGKGTRLTVELPAHTRAVAAEDVIVEAPQPALAGVHAGSLDG